MAALYNDGTLPYGSIDLTINSVVYATKSISVKGATKKHRNYDSIGEPEGQVIVRDFTDGSAVLQLASAATAHPVEGMTFSATIQNATSATYIVTSVEVPLDQDAIKVLNIEFTKRENA